jgi:fructose/tagatose bisphosphate aldolase
MAQRVTAVPNPRYNVTPLETTGATIVSARRVMVPPVIQGSFKGQRDYSGSNLNYITFQLADNEACMDMQCLYMIADLTVYGPNAADNH